MLLIRHYLSNNCLTSPFPFIAIALWNSCIFFPHLSFEPNPIRFLSLLVYRNSSCQGHHWPHIARSFNQTSSSILLCWKPLTHHLFYLLFPSWNTFFKFRITLSSGCPPCPLGSSTHFSAGSSSYWEPLNIPLIQGSILRLILPIYITVHPYLH